MFNESKIHLGSPIKKITEGIVGEVVYVYKVRAPSKKPYMIRLEKYKYDTYFLKFYPKNLELSTDKYKFRNEIKNSNRDLPRLVACCIDLAKKIQKKNPDAIFALYGQWDEVDVARRDEISQRYRIYRIVLASKAREQDFVHVVVPPINTYFIIPVAVYTEALKGQITQYFEELFKESIPHLSVPLPNTER